MTINFNPMILAQIRSMTETLFTDTCTIEVGEASYGSMGELLSNVYGVISSDVPCRVITVGTRYKESGTMTAERETIIDTYRIVMPYATEVSVNQRITLASDGSQWHVIDLVADRTDKNDTQVIVNRIRG